MRGSAATSRPGDLERTGLRLRRYGFGFRPARQRHREACAAERRICDAYLTARTFDDDLDDCQTDTGAGTRAGTAAAHAQIENRLSFGRRNSRSVVVDVERNVTLVVHGADRN